MKEISFCGIKCCECPLYIATQTNDQKMKKSLAIECSNENCTFEPEDMTCLGCHSEKSKDGKMCSHCEIRKCAEPKNITTCADCSNYPCYLIDQYTREENRMLLDSLRE